MSLPVLIQKSNIQIIMNSAELSFILIITVNTAYNHRITP